MDSQLGEREGLHDPHRLSWTYLRLLATFGYGPSEVETEVADGSEGSKRAPRSHPRIAPRSGQAIARPYCTIAISVTGTGERTDRMSPQQLSHK